MGKHLAPPIPYGSRSFLSDSGEMLKDIYQANSPDDAVILHYPNASFDFWQRKYARLGKLPKPLLERRDIREIHVVSSLVVLSRDRRTQERFYKTFIMQDECGDLAFLASHGVVQRVEGVK